MAEIDRYLEAAERANTRRSYASAVRHFEETWGGVLPATPEAVARYLADHAESLSLNTLKLRLAALAHWHRAQGFVDPTKAPLVRQVLKGIGTLHPAREQRALALPVAELARIDAWLAIEIARASARGDRTAQWRATRDRALILIGFWRAFRSDELSRLCVQDIAVVPGAGMTLYLPRTKTDRHAHGSVFKVPALSRLCPVAAYGAWIAAACLSDGPVFRRIDPHGHLGTRALHPNSLVPLLRKRFAAAGVAEPDRYSGHSLRRGFATWASAHQWEVTDLMDYVGWKDPASALRYIERTEAFGRQRIEAALAEDAPPAVSVANREAT